jgi:hypothetical protein
MTIAVLDVSTLHQDLPDFHSNNGAVFDLSPSGSGWTYQTLYEFLNRIGAFAAKAEIVEIRLCPSATRGRQFVSNAKPEGSVAIDPTGNLYSITSDGGEYGKVSSGRFRPDRVPHSSRLCLSGSLIRCPDNLRNHCQFTCGSQLQ